jgi:hypothetical protein
MTEAAVKEALGGVGDEIRSNGRTTRELTCRWRGAFWHWDIIIRVLFSIISGPSSRRRTRGHWDLIVGTT